MRKALGSEQEDGDHPDEEEFLERQTEHLYRIVGGEACRRHLRAARRLRGREHSPGVATCPIET
jgi:hypothetical protein